QSLGSVVKLSPHNASGPDSTSTPFGVWFQNQTVVSSFVAPSAYTDAYSVVISPGSPHAKTLTNSATPTNATTRISECARRTRPHAAPAQANATSGTLPPGPAFSPESPSCAESRAQLIPSTPAHELQSTSEIGRASCRE